MFPSSIYPKLIFPSGLFPSATWEGAPDAITPAPIVTGEIVPSPTVSEKPVIIFGFIGDSITVGYGSPVSPVQVMMDRLAVIFPQYEFNAINLAVSGEHLRTYSRLPYPEGNNGVGVVNSCVTQFLAGNVNFVSIMMGSNDFYLNYAYNMASYTKENYKADMIDVANACVDAGFMTYIHNMTSFDTLNDPNTGIPAWNAQLDSIDYNSMIRRGDTLSYGYFSSHPEELIDGLHPNETGANSLGNMWADAISISLFSDSIAPDAIPTAEIVPVPTIGVTVPPSNLAPYDPIGGLVTRTVESDLWKTVFRRRLLADVPEVLIETPYATIQHVGGMEIGSVISKSKPYTITDGSFIVTVIGVNVGEVAQAFRVLELVLGNYAMLGNRIQLRYGEICSTTIGNERWSSSEESDDKSKLIRWKKADMHVIYTKRF